MTAISSDIKHRIKTDLEALVTSQILGSVIVDNFKVSPIFDRDIAAYPCAIVTGPSIEGSYFTNHDNVRTHTFAVVVIAKMETITADDTVETLIEAILDKFDNDATLGGHANAGLEPASTTPEPITIRTQSYIYFTVILKAKAIKQLS